MGIYYLPVAISFLLLPHVSFCGLELEAEIEDSQLSLNANSNFDYHFNSNLSGRSEAWPHEMCNKTIADNESNGRSEGITIVK